MFQRIIKIITEIQRSLDNDEKTLCTVLDLLITGSYTLNLIRTYVYLHNRTEHNMSK